MGVLDRNRCCADQTAEAPLTISEIRSYVLDSIDVIVQTGRTEDERGILETWFPALEGESG